MFVLGARWFGVFVLFSLRHGKYFQKICSNILIYHAFVKCARREDLVPPQILTTRALEWGLTGTGLARIIALRAVAPRSRAGAR